ncbi:hypothetical protein ACWT_7366 [Actinoplanes sp. SE50]|uniref:peptidogalycan biosysnthesis protein n=1 Tax=unclassified Actinoplanes TaxID=2626549 RepID=UPI00023EE016|nr:MULTISPECIES: peptidogalycan biosysnthesis protein [unclassified Actinoplanes]AEV88376.1 hypothetical protein ACPL_7496 [Actinoplanes sp. SE50/110]ATO86781.1 hypothetical protein ACWT_7366 [Actinoplanes sp. SE50]SLM04199.1 uncharacterized protein ACSP50_7502 [Actinoplanes sp. SE50/110]
MSAEAVFADVTGGASASQWAALAGGHLYSTEPWLTFCATDIGGETRTGALHVGTGDTAAAVTVTAVTTENNSFYQWQDQLVARGLPAPGPVGLLVGQRRGYQTHLLARPGAGDHAGPLLESLRKLRAEVPGTEVLPTAPRGPAPLVGVFLGTSDVAALRSAGADALPVLIATDAWIPVAGGWPDYLRSLPSKGRRDSVKQEVKAFAAAGYELVEDTLPNSYVTAAGLLARTQERYGHPYDLDVLTESFRRQAAAMGDKARVLYCRLPGQPPVGYSLFYIHGDTLFVRAVGFAYDRLIPGAAEYFNLVYYASVRIAAEHGLSWIHPGIESADAKALRGARLRPLWLLDLAEDSVLRDSGDLIRAHNAAVVRRLGESSPAVAKAFDADQCLPYC